MGESRSREENTFSVSWTAGGGGEGLLGTRGGGGGGGGGDGVFVGVVPLCCLPSLKGNQGGNTNLSF